MLRVIDRTHRRPVIIAHHGRPAAETERKEEPTMESYRNQIIAMLDAVTDARLMRTAYEVLKVLFMNWGR